MTQCSQGHCNRFDSHSSPVSTGNTQPDLLNHAAWPREARVKGAWHRLTRPTPATSGTLAEAPATALMPVTPRMNSQQSHVISILRVLHEPGASRRLNVNQVGHNTPRLPRSLRKKKSVRQEFFYREAQGPLHLDSQFLVLIYY